MAQGFIATSEYLRRDIIIGVALHFQLFAEASIKVGVWQRCCKEILVDQSKENLPRISVIRHSSFRL